MFKSARLKLTLFYLVILLSFSLTLTIGIRVLAEQEYNRSNSAQLNEFRRLFLKPFLPKQYYQFGSAQDNEAALVRQHLNQQLLIMNLWALALGGLLSYWFAGRTLRPIEEALRTQTRFAADASHELRTPLTNMQLENEIFLRQKHFSEAEARAQIASNLEEVQRLESLASSLLDLARYGKSSLAPQALDVTKIVGKATAHIKKAAATKKVKLTQHIQPAVVFGHFDSLLQMLGIVLDNAIKYGPKGGTVSLYGHKSGSDYVLQVRDQGPGIAPEDLPYIFDRLYRGDTARSSQVRGYGLGLSLAQEIAAANHASITARNNAPKPGACFEIRLAGK